MTIVYKTAVGATDFGNITPNMAHSLMIILSEQCHATDLVHRAKWILEVSKLLDKRLTFTSDSSWKPGCQTSETISDSAECYAGLPVRLELSAACTCMYSNLLV